MEQIIINQPDGSKTPLISREKASAVTKAEQSVGLLGVDTVAITIKTANPLNFTLGSYIDVFGKEYTLNQLPSIKKTGTRKLEYTLTFEGVQYELIDAQWLLPADTVLDSFTGDLEDFLDILIGNINRVFPGKWVKGIFPADTEFKTLTFIGSNCLEVVQTLCDEYGVEFEIAQEAGVRTLNIKTAGVNFPYTFRYGRTGGLYELTRQNINSKNVVTRLYVYGGSSNLGSSYRYSKLCLTGKEKNNSYIESAAAIAAFGLKENTQTFSEVIPNRIGRVTGAGSKYYAFIDSTMNFDLNETEADGKTTKWLINGVAGKVKFNTGNLAGYEFEIHKYDHATKEIQVVPFTDENGMKFPSETSAAFQFGIGDKYIFTDINLPDAYKTEAEAKLQEEAETYYNQYCQPQVQYALSIDQNFIKQFGGNLTIVNLFGVGDYIHVEDDDLGLKKSIRITAFTRDLLQPYKYTITLGDTVTKTVITRVIEDLQKIDTVIDINNLADPSRARRNWKASQEVLAMVFDPEGDYYTDKIKPGSIETLMLSVGAKSMQFMLQNTLIEANYQGNKNVVKVIGGVLTHYTIVDNIRNWNLATATTVLTSDSDAYYIYAKCQKTGSAGSIVLSSSQITVDEDPNYYHFWIGVINSVVDDVRAVSLTYGATTINGKYITTGAITSADGSCVVDLDGNSIDFGDANSSLSWNKSGDKRLRIKGTIVQDSGGNESDINVDRGLFSIAETYYIGNILQYNGATYRCNINNTSGILPTNASYYTVYAAKGDTGATGAAGPQGVPGTPGSNGKTYYTWIKYADTSTGGGISNDPTNKTYIGFAYNKTTATESNTPADYTWSLIKGAKGDTGVQGAPGSNGQTYYTWIKYSDNADGTGLYDVPTANTKYIGIAVNKTTATESSVKTDYTWSRFKGDTGATGAQGPQGPQGPQGDTGNTIVSMWAKNGSMTVPPSLNNAQTNPSGWSTAMPTATYLEYIWEVKAEKKANGQLVGTWSAPVRISGIGGGSPVGGLDYDPLKKYVGSPIKCDVVRYNGVYYIARIDAGTIPAGTLPNNVSYFNSFGSSFESLATAFLWAENARIANFVFDNQKMVSQAKTNGLANLELDGISGLIKMIKAEIGLFKVVNGDIIGFDTNGNERSRFSAEVLPPIADLNQGWTVISGGQEYYDNDVFERDDSTGLNKKSGTYVFEFPVTVSQACNIRLGTQGGNCALTPHPAGVTVAESNSLAILKNGSVIQQGTMGQIYYLTAGQYTFRWAYTVTANGMGNRTYIEVAINMGYQGIEAQVTPARTLIGSDGLYSVFSGGEYIYFKNGYGFEAKAGNYGIQITTAGVKKRSGSSWVAANW